MLKGIFEQLAQDQNVPKKQAQELLAGMIEKVTSHLKQGDRIRINGLGTLEVRKREAHRAQPRDRRSAAHCSKQEGRVPSRQGTETGGLRSPRLRNTCVMRGGRRRDIGPLAASSDSSINRH